MPAVTIERPAGSGVPFRRGPRPSVPPPLTVALLVLAAPVTIDLLAGGVRRAFSYAAADTFYYLVVAEGWAATGTPTFDGTTPTNGFHPLWQGVLTATQVLAERLGLRDGSVLVASVVIGLIALCGALVLLASALRRAHGGLSPLFALVPFGAYALVVAPLFLGLGGLDADVNPFEGPIPLYGTLWSYANGMESALAVLLAATTVLVLVRRPLTSWRDGAVLGAVLGLLVLSRLDLAFVAGGVLVVLGAAALVRGVRATRAATIVAAATCGAMGLAYLAWNQRYAGVALPVSGTLKSLFPDPDLGNARDLRELLTGNTLFGPLRLYRQGPPIVSGLVGVVAVFRARHLDLDSPAGRLRLVLGGLGLGSCLLAAYDHLFVVGYEQGHWYWPVGTLLVSLVALDTLGSRPTQRAHAAGATLAAAAVAGVGLFLWLGHPSGYHERFADFALVGAEQVLAEASPDLRILAVDDGIDAWALGVPAMSGTGLSLDPEGVEAYERGELLDLAFARGFDRISSVQYIDATGLDRSTPAEVVRERLGSLLSGQHLERFDFFVEPMVPPGVLTAHDGGDGRYVLIRFAPRR